MAKIGEKTWITEIRPTVTDRYWAPQQFAPWSFADCFQTISGLCFSWYRCLGPSITNWYNKSKSNTNAQTHEHSVILLLLCVCLKRLNLVKMFWTFITLRKELTFEPMICRPLHESLSYVDELILFSKSDSFYNVSVLVWIFFSFCMGDQLKWVIC